MCDCVCVLRHPTRPAACDGRGITIVWHSLMAVRLCLPCATSPVGRVGAAVS